jgi:multiple sugar transport system permease protein/sn-glycerol 3-phosphate transport system permease protein
MSVAQERIQRAPVGRPTLKSHEASHGGLASLFLLPSLIGVIGFLLIPVVIVIVLSFARWNMLRPLSWVGFANYVNIFAYDHMAHSILVTLYYVVLNIPIQTALALALAILLNRRLPGSGVIRVICVVPYLATPVAMAVVWNWFFDPHSGAINTFLRIFGVNGPNWLSDPHLAMPVIAFANIWQYTGYNMLFFIAGLQAIPPTLFEAARVDGANAVQQLFRVTLPLLRPTMLFVIVTGLIGSFQVFDMVYVLTQGGPGIATPVMNLSIYQSAFVGFHIGEASAMSVILFLIILFFTITQFVYFRKRTVYEMT